MKWPKCVWQYLLCVVVHFSCESIFSFFVEQVGFEAFNVAIGFQRFQLLVSFGYSRPPLSAPSKLEKINFIRSPLLKHFKIIWFSHYLNHF